MNALTEQPLLTFEQVEREVVARDREVENAYSKDMQMVAVRGARAYLADRITRVAAPHRLLDPKAGPLIAVRLHLLTRKTLGGLQTDLSSRVLTRRRQPAPRPLRGRRGRRLRRWRHARVPLPGGNVPRRLPVLRSQRRPRGRRMRLSP